MTLGRRGGTGTVPLPDGRRPYTLPTAAAIDAVTLVQTTASGTPSAAQLADFAAAADPLVTCAAVAAFPDAYRGDRQLATQLYERAMAEAQTTQTVLTPLLDALLTYDVWPDDSRAVSPGEYVSALAGWINDPARSPEELAGLATFTSPAVRRLIARFTPQWSPALLAMVADDPQLLAAATENPTLAAPDAADLVPLLDRIAPVMPPAWFASLLERLTRTVRLPGGMRDHDYARALLALVPSDGVLRDREDRTMLAARQEAIATILALPVLPDRVLGALVARTRQSPALIGRIISHHSATPSVWAQALWLGPRPATERALAADPRASRDATLRPALGRSIVPDVLETLAASASSGEEQRHLVARAVALRAAAAARGEVVEAPVAMADERDRIFAALDQAARGMAPLAPPQPAPRRPRATPTPE